MGEMGFTRGRAVGAKRGQLSPLPHSTDHSQVIRGGGAGSIGRGGGLATDTVLGRFLADLPMEIFLHKHDIRRKRIYTKKVLKFGHYLCCNKLLYFLFAFC